jgi:hypothetical protein
MTDTELRKLAEAATPGPWSHEASSLHERDHILYSNRTDMMHGLNLMTLADGDWNHVNNVEFITAADPSTILSLLDRLVAAEDRVKRLEEALRPFAEGYKNANREGVEIRDVIDMIDLYWAFNTLVGRK